MAITIPILTDFNGKGIDRGIAQFSKLETSGQKAGFLIRKAALPAAAALGALGAGAFVAAKAAAEDAEAQDKLAGTLRRVTGANDAAVIATEDYITALSQSVGVADDDLRPALGKLATATGDLTSAQGLLSTALDVSAQTGKPLDTVTTALSKAYGGNLTALGRLLPGFDKGIIKSKDFAKAQDELARLTGGAAVENANTAAGQFRKFNIALEETKESIGAALLPVFEAFLPILQRVAKWAQENSGLFVALGAAVAGVSAAVLVVNAAMKAYAAISAVVRAAQVLLNIALAANPIGLVVTAIGLLVAGMVIAYRESETFRGFVDSLFGKLKELWSFLQPVAEVAFSGAVLAFKALSTPIRTVFDAAKKLYDEGKPFFDWLAGIAASVFDKVKTAFSLLDNPINLVKTAFEKLQDFAQPVIDVLSKVKDGVFSTLKTAFTLLLAPIRLVAAALQKVKDLWDWFTRNVQGTGGNPFSGGNFGGTGGTTITGPRSRALSLDTPTGLGTASAAGGVTYVINMSAGLVSTPDQVGQQIIEAVQRAQRRSGPAFVSA